MLLGLGVFAILLVGVIIGLVVWLAKSRERAIQAETVAFALIKGNERSHAANKIMSEPVAYEPAWIRAARDRLRDDDRLS